MVISWELLKCLEELRLEVCGMSGSFEEGLRMEADFGRPASASRSFRKKPVCRPGVQNLGNPPVLDSGKHRLEASRGYCDRRYLFHVDVSVIDDYSLVLHLLSAHGDLGFYCRGLVSVHCGTMSVVA